MMKKKSFSNLSCIAIACLSHPPPQKIHNLRRVSELLRCSALLSVNYLQIDVLNLISDQMNQTERFFLNFVFILNIYHGCPSLFFCSPTTSFLNPSPIHSSIKIQPPIERVNKAWRFKLRQN